MCSRPRWPTTRSNRTAFLSVHVPTRRHRHTGRRGGHRRRSSGIAAAHARRRRPRRRALRRELRLHGTRSACRRARHHHARPPRPYRRNTDAAGAPRFPKARISIWCEEWEYRTSATTLAAQPPLYADPVRKHLLPLAHRVDIFDQRGEIKPGIAALYAPGHTPGHIALSLRSGGEELLYVSDAALHPLHLEHSDWSMVFDMDPPRAVAVAERARRHRRVRGRGPLGAAVAAAPATFSGCGGRGLVAVELDEVVGRRDEPPLRPTGRSSAA